ncbi:hypothetical protein ACFRJ9_15450 [Paenarthrobacter sp. NPDC056912]|uniref:hypothetical protein n=1 Tax=Paenarthrobacter sp. NPDC056912 TaxID=3345965 RepID=UPI00366F74BB
MEIFNGPKMVDRRFRVPATGETGLALSGSHGGTSIGRKVTIGDDLNVSVIDVCLDEAGEVRTYRQAFLEEVAE